jgi:predicted ribonuclease YlaK
MPRQKKTIKPVKEPNEELEAEDVLFKPKLQLKIKELDWTQKQRDFFRLGLDDNTRIVILSGPAGTAKSLLRLEAHERGKNL